MLRPPPKPTLFPYTTLFRSAQQRRQHVQHDSGHQRFAAAEGVRKRADDQLAERKACERSRQGELRDGGRRSEEHTSELQSPCNLVCRLLLEKKNKSNNTKQR